MDDEVTGCPWTGAEGDVDQISHDVMDAVEAAKARIGQRLAAVEIQERTRCLGWVRSGMSPADIADGISSGKDPPGYDPRAPSEDD